MPTRNSERRHRSFKLKRRYQEAHAKDRLHQRYNLSCFAGIRENLKQGNYNILIENDKTPLVFTRVNGQTIYLFITNEPTRARPTINTVITREMAGSYLSRSNTECLTP